MTVLISVIAEAYQSRYSLVMQNGLFDKRIRALKDTSSHSRKNTDAEDEKSHHRTLSRAPDELTIDERMVALECIRKELAGLPELIIQAARDFQVHIRYVGSPSPIHGDRLPPGLARVLQETMDQENMNEAMRKEALHDEAAKKALMMLHLENTARGLVDKAERLTVLLTERDALERERRQEEAAEFDEGLGEADSPVEIGVEEAGEIGAEEAGERRIGDEEMGSQWGMDDNRLHDPPQGSPSRAVSQSSGKPHEPS
jgi:hypothetical protein